MADGKNGTIHSATDGGVVAKHPDADPTELLVAPATSDESNRARLRLIPTACFRIEDVRFKFDSSFVLPEVQAEIKSFIELRKSDPRVLDAPVSVFGHADPSFEGNFEPGSSTAQSGDEYNKKLSGRRAIAIYALFVRDTSLWDDLYTNHLGSDIWGQDSIRTMLNSTNQESAIDDNTVVNISNDSGKRKQLFLQYMNALCGDLKLDKGKDFLARGAGPDLKGDVQGCSRFNPLILFSQEDESRFKLAYQNKDQESLAERNANNAPNRRVVVLIYKKGSQVLPSKWFCPTYKEGPAVCRTRFFPNGDKLRSTHFSGSDHKFEDKDKHDTFACRFFQRISDGSPCNAIAPPPPPKVKRRILKITANLPVTQSVRGTGAVAPPFRYHTFSSVSNVKDLASNAPTVLVRNCKDIDLVAQTDPPNQKDVVWNVEPNPGPATPLPVKTPSGSTAKLKTDAAGGYSVSASLDGTTVYWNVVFVNVEVKNSAILKSRLNFTDNSGGGSVGTSSGTFDTAHPAVCAMYVSANIELSAGGEASLTTYLDKVHVGFPQNLLNDSAKAAYHKGGQERERIVVPPNPASPIVDPWVVVADLGYPILDRGGDRGTRATGGSTIFLSSTKSTPATGTPRKVETCDSPGVGFDDLLPELGKVATQMATAISGVNAFRLYLAAYSDDANFSYVAFAQGDWTADYTGNIIRIAGLVRWFQTSANITGDNQLTVTANGKEAQAAGCEVRPPVFLDYVIDAR
jgi:hypothetical protein